MAPRRLLAGAGDTGVTPGVQSATSNEAQDSIALRKTFDHGRNPNDPDMGVPDFLHDEKHPFDVDPSMAPFLNPLRVSSIQRIVLLLPSLR